MASEARSLSHEIIFGFSLEYKKGASRVSCQLSHHHYYTITSPFALSIQRISLVINIYQDAILYFGHRHGWTCHHRVGCRTTSRTVQGRPIRGRLHHSYLHDRPVLCVYDSFSGRQCLFVLFANRHEKIMCLRISTMSFPQLGPTRTRAHAFSSSGLPYPHSSSSSSSFKSK